MLGCLDDIENWFSYAVTRQQASNLEDVGACVLKSFPFEQSIFIPMTKLFAENMLKRSHPFMEITIHHHLSVHLHYSNGVTSRINYVVHACTRSSSSHLLWNSRETRCRYALTSINHSFHLSPSIFPEFCPHLPITINFCKCTSLFLSIPLLICKFCIRRCLCNCSIGFVAGWFSPNNSR